jgi:hypothetical protein
MREKLPPRRPCVTRVLETERDRYYINFGYDPVSGAIREVFIKGSKIGSDMDILLDDASLLLSLALQFGLDLTQAEHSINSGREEDGTSVLAHAIRLMAEETGYVGVD